MTDWPRHAGSAIFSLFYAHVLSEMNKYETNHLSAPTVKTTLVWMSFHFLTAGGLVHVKIFVSDGWLWGWIMSHKSEGRKIFEDKEAIIPPPPKQTRSAHFQFSKAIFFYFNCYKRADKSSPKRFSVCRLCLGALLLYKWFKGKSTKGQRINYLKTLHLLMAERSHVMGKWELAYLNALELEIKYSPWCI